MLASLNSLRTGTAARHFKDFAWSMLDSWSRHRRVVSKAFDLLAVTAPAQAPRALWSTYISTQSSSCSTM